MENQLKKGITFNENIEPMRVINYQQYPHSAAECGCRRLHSDNPIYGEKKMNNSGYSEMEILQVFTKANITIGFKTQLSTGDEVYYVKYNQNYQNFKKGELKSPYEPLKYGVGYIGDGPHKRKKSKFGLIWHNMMTRCYNPNSLEVRPGYVGCSVHPFFHNFQNFHNWCEMNYYTVDNETMCLDKDILFNHNRIYGPMTCIFVPQTINKLFTHDRSISRAGLPLGVCARDGKYYTRCNTNNIETHLGTYPTAMDAFKAYKVVKEKEIKRVAEEYKGKIPEILYRRMMNYEVQPY